MKKIIAIIALCTLTLGIVAAVTPTPETQKDETSKDAQSGLDFEKISYAMGLYLGRQLTQDENIDLEEIKRGLEDGLNAVETPELTTEEIAKILNSYQEHTQEKRQKERQAQLATIKIKNKNASLAFLAEHKQKTTVIEHPSGILYRVIKPGTGPTPTEQDTVVIKYIVKTIDGTVIQDTITADKSTPVKLAHLIPGWKIALQEMQSGAHWEVVVPADLAYGESGIPGRIEPNSALIFEINLISIETPVEEESNNDTANE